MDTDVGVQRHDACVGDTNPSPSKSKVIKFSKPGGLFSKVSQLY